MRRRYALALLALAAVVLSSADRGAGGEKRDKLVTTKSGLKYIDEKVGTGKTAKRGDKVEIHYTGRLKDGTKFESSRDRGKPTRFPLTPAGVIKGWLEGVPGMKEGGKRKLIIPPELAHGKDGVVVKGKTIIPPDAELTYDIELIRVLD